MKMPWGKHMGEEIGDLPTDYLEWVLGNTNIAPLYIEEMETELELRSDRGARIKKKDLEDKADRWLEGFEPKKRNY